MKVARNATSVLPKPTSPQISRSIGRPADRSSRTAVDRGLLVVGLLIGKARRKLAVEPVRRVERDGGAHLALGGDADELAGHFEQALLQPGLARLPGAAAETVELRLGRIRTVARQKLDVFDRQIELAVGGVVDFEAVMRRADRLDGLQADEAADAVVGMHDDVAGRQRCRLGDEIGGASCASWSGAPAGRPECPARR